jgi:hypothetical protein
LPQIEDPHLEISIVTPVAEVLQTPTTSEAEAAPTRARLAVRAIRQLFNMVPAPQENKT